MKKLKFLLLNVISAISVGEQLPSIQKVTELKFNTVEINKLVTEFMASTGTTGVAISLVNRGTHQEHYFGKTGRETLFEIGSITKVFTPHLLIVAHEEGRILIEDPAIEHVSLGRKILSGIQKAK